MVNEFDILAENVHPDISDLISAAPDMLEALEQAKRVIESASHEFSIIKEMMVIRAAIKKAKGKS